MRPNTRIFVRIAASAATAFFFAVMPTAFAANVETAAVGQECPAGSANRLCGPGTDSNIKCVLKSDVGKIVCVNTNDQQTGAVVDQKNGSDVSSTAPVLAVKIPTVTFSRAFTGQAGGKTVMDVPFIAEYITGVYKYGVGIASIIAAIMMMIGGFQYLTAGGDQGRVTAAKERIKDALIGMALTLGSYVILYTINPDLTALKGTRITVVRREQFEAKQMQSATEDVAPGDLPSTSVAGSHTNPFTTCPMNLTAAPDSNTAPSTNARSVQFYDQVSTIATASTITERVVQVADAAAVCKVYFGSCGRTAGTIYTLAGKGSKTNRGALSHKIDAGTACLYDEKGGGCWTHEQSKQLKTLPAEQVRGFSKYFCANGCTGEKANPPGCGDTRVKARALAIEDLTKVVGGGYPDTFSQLLQPGDTIWIYNTWPSCGGLHSIVFMGWGANGMAQIVNGSPGKFATATSICLGPGCSDRYPMVKIFRP